MKKLLAMVLAIVMVLSLAACAGDANKPANGSENDNTNNTAKTAKDLVSEAFIDPVNDWAKYDELIAKIKAETDKAARTEMMHEAEDILMSTGCVVPLYFYTDIYMIDDSVNGFFSNPLGYKYFMYTTIG